VVGEELRETGKNLQSVGGAMSQVGSVFASISGGVQYLLAALASAGLTQTQAMVIVGVLFLISFIAVLKFIVLITKLLIVGLIVWVVLSILGIL
jgi:hypothetical protein